MELVLAAMSDKAKHGVRGQDSETGASQPVSLVIVSPVTKSSRILFILALFCCHNIIVCTILPTFRNRFYGIFKEVFYSTRYTPIILGDAPPSILPLI